MIEKENCYRRDLIYSCEYSTTVAIEAPIVVIEQINISGGQDKNGPLIETIYE
jgi:hypothetical protein